MDSYNLVLLTWNIVTWTTHIMALTIDAIRKERIKWSRRDASYQITMLLTPHSRNLSYRAKESKCNWSNIGRDFELRNNSYIHIFIPFDLKTTTHIENIHSPICVHRHTPTTIASFLSKFHKATTKKLQITRNSCSIILWIIKHCHAACTHILL